MAAPVYKNLIFPHAKGGYGPYTTVAITLDNTDDATALADLTAYYAASDANKAKHDLFNRIVQAFMTQAVPVEIVSGSATSITLKFEHLSLFQDNDEGKPPFFYSSGDRPNASDIMTALESDSVVTAGWAVVVS